MFGLSIPATQPQDFLWFLPLTLPIAIWVAWSDMARMRIPNQAVLSLAAVWLIGPLVLSLDVWLWGIALMAIVLVIGFAATMLGLVGGGDAKFAAAMAPFFTGADLRVLAALFAACVVGGFVMHRIMRAIPAVRRALPDWKSWTHRKFPMGLCLAGTLIFWPLLALIVP